MAKGGRPVTSPVKATDKTAVISGGAGGLGRAIAAALQAEGWRTILLDLRVDSIADIDRQLSIACDLTDPSQLQDAVQTCIASSPSIDLVIYNAGLTQVGPFANLDDTAHRKLFEVNYFAAVAMARGFLVAVRQSGGTHLAISSVAGLG